MNIKDLFNYEPPGEMTDGQYVLKSNTNVYVQECDPYVYGGSMTEYLVHEMNEAGTEVEHHGTHYNELQALGEAVARGKAIAEEDAYLEEEVELPSDSDGREYSNRQDIDSYC